MIEEVVPAGLSGERVDRVVAFLADCSRSEAATLVEAGAVTVDGRPVRKGSHRVDEGDAIVVDTGPIEVDTRPGAEASVEVDIIHADADIVVVDKPAGLVVHPGAGNPGGTLVNGLLARYPEIAQVGDPARPGIVHRLDKGTSGVLVVARTQRAYESLVEALRARRVERRYLAVVSGIVEADRGVIDARLGRSRRHPTRRAVVADGRDARTHYEVVSRHQEPFPATVLRCTLETGRTHQIRVHLSAIGHPVLGDDLYGRSGASIGRPALHAEHVAFVHPATGETMRFDSPMPDDLAALVSRLH